MICIYINIAEGNCDTNFDKLILFDTINLVMMKNMRKFYIKTIITITGGVKMSEGYLRIFFL